VDDRPLVCIDCRYLRERPSGMTPMIQSLVDFLPGWAPDLRFLFLRHPKAPAPLSRAPNVTERVVRLEPNSPSTMWFLPRLVDLRGVALFHATFNFLPFGLTMPTVVTINDVMWMTHPEWARKPGLWGRLETPFYRIGIRNALRHATHITTISQASWSEIVKLEPAAASRTSISREGVSTEVFHPMSDRAFVDATREKWVPGAKRFVLTIGQYAGYKNHQTVVRAFARAFRHDPDVHAVLIQRLGSGRAILEGIARQEGVHGRVHFARNVPERELVALYNGAIALCHPSLVEGFGNCPSEALACGCPVVTSNRSSMPEVSADAGLYVDPECVDSVADGLRRVADDPALAASMREKGLRRASELTWQAYAEGNLDAYRTVLGSVRR
jgi:glycosyltransferase involved in cell wall biosynthesis